MFLVSRETGEAIRGILRKSRETPPRTNDRNEQGRIPLIVRCTSTTPAGSGVGAECFPAVVVDHDSGELAADQPELGDVWLMLAHGETPTSGTKYIGLLSGEFDPGDDPRPVVFGVQGGGGAIEYGALDMSDHATTADDTWEDTGESMDLEPGNYILFAQIQGHGRISANGGTIAGTVFARLYNVTDGSASFFHQDGLGAQSIFTTCVIASVPVTGQTCYGCGVIIVPWEITSAKTVRLEIMRHSNTGAVTWHSAGIGNSLTGVNAGRTLGYIRLDGGGGSGGCECSETSVEAEVTTTDGTVTTCGEYTLDDDTAYLVEANVVGRATSGASSGGGIGVKLAATVWRTGGGGATIGGSPTTIHNGIHPGLSGVSAAFNASSNNIRIRVTGLASVNINWKTTLWIRKLTT